jgi:hypothetical protein
MTTHPNEGLILGFLDDELEPRDREDIGAHLDRCEACRITAEGLRGSSRFASERLLLLDVEAPTDSARRSLDRRIQRKGLRPLIRFPGMAKAAGIALLLVGGTVSALPGSPVRQWILAGWERVTHGNAPSADEPQATPSGSEGASAGSGEESGAGIPTAGGVVEILISDLPANAEVRVLLVDGDNARIYGPPGTHFRTETGRVEAVAPRGAVRVELPHRARVARVIVNGELYLRKNGEQLEILGPVRDSAAAEIRFHPQTREDPNGGST